MLLFKCIFTFTSHTSHISYVMTDLCNFDSRLLDLFYLLFSHTTDKLFMLCSNVVLFNHFCIRYIIVIVTMIYLQISNKLNYSTVSFCMIDWNVLKINAI